MDASRIDPGGRFLEQVSLICDSYFKLLGSPLFPEAPRAGPEQVDWVWTSPRVVVSHDGETDPTFNFGNQAALQLWEMSLDEFVGLPSRYSAEAEHRGARERLLREVAEHGVSSNYSGVRASKSGRRFIIERAVVFNLVDEAGIFRGQAATFTDWTFL